MFEARDPIRDLGDKKIDGQTFAGRRVERKSEAAPRGHKNFKEVADKGKKENEDPEVAQPLAEVAGAQPSIFDLARGVPAAPPAVPMAVPFTPAAPQVPAKPVVKAPESHAVEGASELVEEVAEFDVKPMKPKAEALPRNAFAADQSDLASVNPAAAAGQPVVDAVPLVRGQAIGNPEIPGASRAHLQEIVDQIVSKLYTVSTSDKTDTTVVLKYPPMLAGVSVVISTVKIAPHEINIAFTNLTQAAKTLLDLPHNVAILKQLLSEKEITVHIITTSAQIEPPSIAKVAEPGRGEDKQFGSSSREDDEDNERRHRQRRGGPF